MAKTLQKTKMLLSDRSWEHPDVRAGAPGFGCTLFSVPKNMASLWKPSGCTRAKGWSKVFELQRQELIDFSTSAGPGTYVLVPDVSTWEWKRSWTVDTYTHMLGYWVSSNTAGLELRMLWMLGGFVHRDPCQ